MHRKIIFATDFSKNNKKACNFLKKNYTPEDEIILLHVISDSGFSDPPPSNEQINNDYKEKTLLLEGLAKNFNCRVSLKLLKGEISKTITNYIQKESPNLLVIGSHRLKGFMDRILNRDIKKEIMDCVECPIVCC